MVKKCPRHKRTTKKTILRWTKMPWAQMSASGRKMPLAQNDRQEDPLAEIASDPDAFMAEVLEAGELTQREIAEEVGVTDRTVRNMVDRKKMPSAQISASEPEDDFAFDPEAFMAEVLEAGEMTQREIAEEVGCSLDTVNRVAKTLTERKVPPVLFVHPEPAPEDGIESQN